MIDHESDFSEDDDLMMISDMSTRVSEMKGTFASNFPFVIYNHCLLVFRSSGKKWELSGELFFFKYSYTSKTFDFCSRIVKYRCDIALLIFGIMEKIIGIIISVFIFEVLIYF